jgi:hypothetical protein
VTAHREVSLQALLLGFLQRRDFAAFFAARFRLAGPFVLDAFFADALRLLALRLLAADRVCFDRALRDAVDFGSRFKAPLVALDRLADAFFRECDCPRL